MNMIKLLTLLTLVWGSVSYADYELESLDKLSTCASEQQKVAANQVLTFLENFRWWKIKNLVNSIHPEYTEWHASRVYLATLYPPEAVPQLPYKNGLVTNEGFVKNLAMIAYNNDVPKYTLDLKRVECLGSDTIVVSSIFNGMNIYRNTDGKALYQTEIKDVPTRFVVTVKEGMIYRNVIDLEDATSQKMIEALGALIKKGVPNVEPGTIPDLKFEDILRDFENQAKN